MKREEEEAKKDRSLAELLGMLDGYRPVVSTPDMTKQGQPCRLESKADCRELSFSAQIPEGVTDYYLQRSGFESHDPRL